MWDSIPLCILIAADLAVRCVAGRCCCVDDKGGQAAMELSMTLLIIIFSFIFAYPCIKLIPVVGR